MGVTTEQEHNFERAAISKRRKRYLDTDIMTKVQRDPGYSEKVSVIEAALAHTTDWILDVGANTCGESEYLTARGYKIIANDINEVALEISRERCARFGRPSPEYLACDAQHLRLANERVSFVIFNESMHHMPDPPRALAEAACVLKPGGRLFLYEPYAYNPYRRLSEVRDYFRGTVEKSFGVRQLRGLLAEAGFEIVSLERHVCAGFRMETRAVWRDPSCVAEGVRGGLEENAVAVRKCDDNCREARDVCATKLRTPAIA